MGWGFDAYAQCGGHRGNASVGVRLRSAGEVHLSGRRTLRPRMCVATRAQRHRGYTARCGRPPHEERSVLRCQKASVSSW